MFSNKDFGELRKIEGCERLADIKTDNYLEKIRKIKGSLGFDHIYEDENPDFNKVQKTFKEILKRCKKMSGEGKPHMLMLFGIGHGFTN